MQTNNTATTLMRIIFLISLGSTLGSLYYGYFGDPAINFFTGEFFNSANGLPPCEICWYIRICMFPLAMISGIALIKKDLNSVDYMLPLAILGVIFSVYKYRLQKFAPTQDSGFCVSGVPCSDISAEYFGFMTLPFLSGVACIIIILCIIWIKKTQK